MSPRAKYDKEKSEHISAVSMKASASCVRQLLGVSTKLRTNLTTKIQAQIAASAGDGHDEHDGKCGFDAKDTPRNDKLMSRIKASDILLGIKCPRATKTSRRCFTKCGTALLSAAVHGHFLHEFGQSCRVVAEN